MTDGAKRDVDDVSFDAFEWVSFQMAVLHNLSDHRLDAVSPS